jgi:hypothetical protein
MTAAELTRLHELLRAAQAVVDRPFEHGETSRPIEFFTDHLPDEAWLLGWKLVAELRRTHPDLFAVYDEQRLHFAALEWMLRAAVTPTLQGVAEALAQQAESEEGSWLVSIPLANVSLGRSWASAGPNAALRPAYDGRQEAESETDTSEAEFAIFHHLHDRLPLPVRTIRFGDGTEIDTKRTATLLIVQDGSRLIAVRQAVAKAHHAIAAWAVLAPPRRWHLIPDVATWFPQPDTHHETEHKRLEPDEFISREPRQGAAMRQWAPYDLPDDETLSAPFEAFEHLEMRSAQALLSATSAHHAAARGSRALLSTQIREVRRAIECLCEPAQGSTTGAARVRWDRLSNRLEIWRRAADARAYTPATIAELQKRIENARNIGSHGADAALLDLGWSAGDRQLLHDLAASTDLTLAALSRDLGPVLFALGEALRIVWSRMRTTGFDDEAFEALFAP